MVSTDYEHFENTCLATVRSCIEVCERDEEGTMMLSFELFQAVVLLARFELTHRKILRAWMTIGRAVRLANILRLHLDVPVVEQTADGLPPATDALCVEERRRAFWTLYVCETYAGSRARLPPLLQEHQITVPLPSASDVGTDAESPPLPTLADSYSISDIHEAQISPFAGIVFACAIARQSQSHAETAGATAGVSQPSTPIIPPGSALAVKEFWDRHFALMELLKHRATILAPYLTVRAVQTCSVSFALYVYLCGIDMALQESALAQVAKQNLTHMVAADSAKRSREAAYKLVGVVRGTLQVHRSSVSPSGCLTQY